mmetsp:Transcript_20646/g.64549  ORF Transcript_20646/g.64549 Transcript_20646/m.64549 type:complete len:282 (-) Transcript_20646:64-909(-)
MAWGKPPPQPAAAVVPSMSLSDLLSDEWVLQWVGGLFVLQFGWMALLYVVPSPMSSDVGMAAHQLTAAVPFAYAAYHGTRLWYFDEQHAALGADARGRLYAASEDAFSLARFMFGMQVFDLLVTLIVPSLRKAEHLVHHGMTLLTALCGLSGPFLMYQGAFFFGFVEVSSLPLVFVDLFRQFPRLHEGSPAGHSVNEMVRVAFAVSFLLIRCVLWPLAVLQLLRDLYAVWAAGELEGQLQMATFCVTCSVLTFLQLYWGGKIVRALLKMLAGDSSGREKEA